MNIGRTGKYYYYRLLRLKGSPHALALGAAWGVFVGITPTIPLHTIAILIITLLTRSSFVAGVITSWIVCNPLTYFPLYYGALVIGNLITPYELNWEKIKSILDLMISDASFMDRFGSLMELGYETVVVMLSGGIILALPFGVLSYYATYLSIVTFRKKRSEKRVLH